MKEELVVLVDEQNNVLGTVPKSQVHSQTTPLHRAFSSFIFNSKGQILLQQRSSQKKTWPLVWSNTCCGHPGLNESNINAAKRRLKDELNLEASYLEEVQYYRYQFVRYNVMENEICPIIVGFTDKEPIINPDEVEEIQWMDWAEFVKETEQNDELVWSEWCVEEVQLLQKNDRFLELWNEYITASA